ncbi:hypothetical protein DAI22_11g072100 [Oryza sativa Japonica Group]|nr:hypothetical protein DAI22_11g072100 [Oryza sativa Japonica Group]KAF2910067.1 hypothetical protein DAI22_11g072100 [Oryza sativa Japonica Group]KAF2910068.1 hypothetical protein DAI22_11g072100 [Oryza sativa Japonica Group]
MVLRLMVAEAIGDPIGAHHPLPSIAPSPTQPLATHALSPSSHVSRSAAIVARLPRCTDSPSQPFSSTFSGAAAAREATPPPNHAGTPTPTSLIPSHPPPLPSRRRRSPPRRPALHRHSSRSPPVLLRVAPDLSSTFSVPPPISVAESTSHSHAWPVSSAPSSISADRCFSRRKLHCHPRRSTTSMLMMLLLKP